MESLKTIEECKLNIQEFANKHELIFEVEGECGFRRECIGFSSGGNYVDYNPRTTGTDDYLQRFYDERFYDITPPNAYHKHTCFAVLGRDDDSVRQLSDWVDSLNQIGIKFEEYETGATGIQAIFSGTISKAVRVI